MISDRLLGESSGAAATGRRAVVVISKPPASSFTRPKDVDVVSTENYPGGVGLNCPNVRSDSIAEEALPRPLAVDASRLKTN
jgi:hypothetical protein